MEGSNVAHSITLGGSATTETALDNSVNNQNDVMSIAETVTLGQTNIETTLITGGYNLYGHYIATPIHTSSHYQTFETPFLHELVGGDRNMEQNNLIVTPDGKSWDEVTRDTSYIGNLVVSTSTDTASTATLTVQIWDEWRGATSGIKYHFNKDFAIAYDRIICLKSGQYSIKSQTRANTANQETCRIVVNGTMVKTSKPYADLVGSVSTTATLSLNRGDYIQHTGAWFADNQYANFEIIRVN